MSVTYNLQLTAGLAITWTHTAAGGTLANTPSDPLNEIMSLTLDNGTALNQCNIGWASTRSLASTTETLNFSNSSLVDAFGVGLAFAKIKFLAIWNQNTTAGQTLVIGNATNPLALFSAGTATYTIGPNGRFIIAEPSLAGITVTGSSADSLKLNSGSATVTYTIIVAGTNA
ncbi:MAG TPA: hypothetical protein VF175_09585 [Lacipirellula sp.]